MKGTEESLSPAWERIKTVLATQIDRDAFSAWIAPLKASESSEGGGEITVSIPNPVFYQGLMDQYLGLIEECKSQLGIDHILLRFEVAGAQWHDGAPLREMLETPAAAPVADQMMEPTVAVPVAATTEKATISQSLKSPRGGLNRNYTFETFVPGASNQFALATCLNVAENPGKNYNPLFIYGSTGLGKTHLLHAVGNRILDRNPSASVCYISSERFMNELVYCIRFSRMWDFRQKYRHSDVLLVDDIQFIRGDRRSTQEEFFHTFNALYELKKQIVITSDLFPQDIPDIEDRLRNRFQWGLIADIQPPNIEHRIAILYKKAEELGVKIASDVAEYIAHQAKRNVRELEGALHRITAFANLHGRVIDRALAVETFQNVLGEPPRRLTVEVVQKLVADHFKMKVAELKSKKRQRALTLPRQIAMYLARKMTESSFPEIGERFGGKDHTTVMHAVRKIEEERLADLDLKAHVDTLERQLEQLQ